MGMEFYTYSAFTVVFLCKIFLCPALFAFFLLFGLFYLFHKIALAVAMQPGSIAVFAKISRYVFLVQFKACVNKQA